MSRCPNSMLLFLVVTLCVSTVSHASAQLSDDLKEDDLEVSAAVVEHLIEMFPGLAGGAELFGRQNVVLDPYVLRFGDAARSEPVVRSTQFMEAAASRLGTRHGRLEDFRTCTGSSPASCQLTGQAQLIVRMGEISGDAERVEVPVLVVYPLEQDTRQPVHSATLQVSLVKNAEGVWVVRQAEVTAIT